VNYDNSLVMTITVTCNLWAPSSGDHFFTCGAIHLPPQLPDATKQTKDYAWQLLARPQCRFALKSYSIFVTLTISSGLMNPDFKNKKNVPSFNCSLSQTLHWKYKSHWAVWAL